MRFECGERFLDVLHVFLRILTPDQNIIVVTNAVLQRSHDFMNQPIPGRTCVAETKTHDLELVQVTIETEGCFVTV